MATVEVDLGEFGKELGKLAKKNIEAVRLGTLRGALRSLPGLVAASPVDTGQFASSWRLLETEKSVILGNFAPHAPIIERGARPFRPPIGPLLAWAKRVLQDPSQPPSYSSQVWALAVGTQKKIEQFGMRPRRVLENYLPVIIDNIKKEIEAVS